MAGFIVVGLICVAICYIVGSMRGETAANKQNLEEMEKVCETSRDAYEASRLIAKFMKPREWVCRMDVCYSDAMSPKDGKLLWTFTELPNGWSKDGIGFHECTFIRLCHYLGCEVIVRQVGSDFGTDESMHNQVKTYMREKLRRKNISTVYPHDKKFGDKI